MSIVGSVAVAVAVLLGVLVMFQLALAAGAPLGRAAYGGAHRVLPGHLRVASVAAALVWVLAAGAVLARAGVMPDATPGAPALVVVVWMIVGLLAVGLVLNVITPSRVERMVWGPVTLLLLAGTLVVALSA